MPLRQLPSPPHKLFILQTPLQPLHQTSSLSLQPTTTTAPLLWIFDVPYSFEPPLVISVDVPLAITSILPPPPQGLLIWPQRHLLSRITWDSYSYHQKEEEGGKVAKESMGHLPSFWWMKIVDDLLRQWRGERGMEGFWTMWHHLMDRRWRMELIRWEWLKY